MLIELRGGDRVVVSRSAHQRSWSTPRLCPACKSTCWAIRYAPNKEPHTHVSARGVRARCPAFADPIYTCNGCQTQKRSRVGKPPAGWLTTPEGVICSSCVEAARQHVCASCGIKRRSTTGRPPRGWALAEGGARCTSCKEPPKP